MYAALDLHEKSIQCVLKDDTGKIVRESKFGKDEEKILEFLDGTHASVVMESGYNHQHIRDVLKEKGYDVKVAHPLMVKAIAYAKVKSDKVDARTLADLLRADMIPEAYVPDEKTREVRDPREEEAQPGRDADRVQEQGEGGARDQVDKTPGRRIHA